MARNSIWSREETLGRQQYIEGLLRQQKAHIHLKDLAFALGHLVNEDLDEKYRGRAFHNSNYRRILTRDIDELNRNPDFRLTIISDSKGVKLCSQTDLERMYRSERREALKKLAKCAKIAQKAGLDGQTVLVTAEEIEAFAEA